MALAAVPAALVARRVGPGRAAAVGLAIFAGAGLACGLADSLTTLVVARCIQAVGGAAAVTAALELLPATVGSERRAGPAWAGAGAAGAAPRPAPRGGPPQPVPPPAALRPRRHPHRARLLAVDLPPAGAGGAGGGGADPRGRQTRGGDRRDRAGAAPHRPPAPLGEPGAGDGLGGDRGGALPARPAADRRLAAEPDQGGDRGLGDAAGGAGGGEAGESGAGRPRPGRGGGDPRLPRPRPPRPPS